MCPFFTSSFEPEARPGWQRLRRLGLYVLALLAGLELFFRLPLVEPLQKYERLLWYDIHLASYDWALRNGSHHSLWLLGSSYMMTGLDPQIIQPQLQSAGFAGVTVQNYGLNAMQNLEVMGQVFDRWLFRLDQPEYAVLAVASGNFGLNPPETQRIRQSALESALIFPDSLEDYVGGFLYRHSALVHYGVLLRNVIDSRDAQVRSSILDQPFPLSGYIRMDGVYQPESCDLSAIWGESRAEELLASAMYAGYRERQAIAYAELDTFVEAIRSRDIPVLIVIMPDQACFIGNYATYDDLVIAPLVAHLRALGVPVADLNRRFRAEVVPEWQHTYFRDTGHPNQEGAELLSRWTASFVADWLRGLAAG